MPQAKIVILGTGGTIAGQAQSSTQGVGYVAGQLSVAGLLAAVPDLPQLIGGGADVVLGEVLDAVQIAQIDSKDMDWPVWRSLLKAVKAGLDDAGTKALVITHGTDTLEETTWLLQLLLQPTKPVVLTCAMRPATSLQADGPQNLRDAVVVAADGGAGVWVVAAGEVHAAREVLKVHPYRLNALRSYEGGPCAYVEEGRVRWLGRAAAQYSGLDVVRLEQLLASDELPWVEIVQSGALQSARAVQALVAAGVQGLVVAGTGNGSLHQAMKQALLEAKAQGVSVWLTTRCLEGQVVGAQSVKSRGNCKVISKAHSGAETHLGCDEIAAHVIQAEGEDRLDTVLLPPSKARIALMLYLVCS
ncbi:asparaginase [Comamonas sp. Y33R10-2]|uniref:asparaginase n=1 Tax=Comamonas sp. Y33R10-2 TaxID=2853257 RepID=UPI001C5CA882|nr:asparaginase [Comamonas sp. Y33R10-2]QXZ10901.1 asparaginase [Comamonas sp. Y33R10-2]